MKHKFLVKLLFTTSLLTPSLASCSLDGIFNKGSSSSTINSTPVNPEKDDYISFYSINDLHGKIEYDPESYYNGISKLDYAIKNDPYFNSSSVIFGGGDLYQGSGLSNISKGTYTQTALAMMGVKASCIGNHEFDWGLDTLKSLVTTSEYKFLNLNAFDKNKNKLFNLDSSMVLEVNSLKVGVIGAIGNLSNSISQRILDGVTFNTDVKLVQNEVNKLKKDKKCDITLLLVHDGPTSSYVENIRTSVAGLDAIFGGHTHQFEQHLDQIPFLEAGADSRGYARFVFSKNKKGKFSVNTNPEVSNFIQVSTEEDTDSSKYNQEIVNYIESLDRSELNRVIATSDSYFYRYETYKGSLFSLILHSMWYLFETYNQVDTQNVRYVILHNSAGVRANLTSNTWTYSDLLQVSPFDNRIVIIEDVPSYSVDRVTTGSKGNNFYMFKGNTSSFTRSVVITIEYLTTNPSFKDLYREDGGEDIKKEGGVTLPVDGIIEYLQDEKKGSVRGADYKYPIN